MKNIIFLCLLALVASIGASAQKILINRYLMKKNHLFLNYETKSTEKICYFGNEDNTNNRSALKTGTLFSLKNYESCNLFIEWQNPLIYRWSLSDTTSIDPRYEAIDDFIRSFSDMMKITQAIDTTILLSYGNKSGEPQTTVKITYPTNYEFKDSNLEYLRQLIYQGTSNKNKADSTKISNLFAKLKKIDHNNPGNLYKTIITYTKSLSEAKDLVKFKNNIDDIKVSYANKNKEITATIDSIGSLDTTISKFKLSKDTVLAFFIKLVTTDYFNRTLTLMKANSVRLTSFKGILTTCENSYSDTAEGRTNYIAFGEVPVNRGQRTIRTLKLEKYQYDDSLNFKKTDKSFNQSLCFERYDPWDVKLGTGLFYTNIKFTEFGVGTDSTGNMIVTEGEVDNKKLATSLTLNFIYNDFSDFLTPMFQIGIDPFKKHPYISLGIGGYVGAKNFGFSFGPIWTWNPILENMSVGQKVSSSVELDNAIHYEFDIERYGYFIGVVYKFK